MTNVFQCPLCPWQYDAPDPFDVPPDATAELLAELGASHTQAVQTTLADHFDTHPVTEWVNEVARLRTLLNDRPPVVCLGCFIDRHQAQKAGVPLPPQNLAQLIVNGAGMCPGHVRIPDGPVLPGRTESGLILDTRIPPAPGANGAGG